MLKIVKTAAVFTIIVAFLMVQTLYGWNEKKELSNNQQYEVGKKIFIAKCASCHGEKGEKPFENGPVLNERTLKVKTIISRLRENRAEEQKAVIIYLENNMKKNGKVVNAD